MAKLLKGIDKNKNEYKYIKATIDEIALITGNTPFAVVCDYCNKPTLEMYIIPYTNRCACKNCIKRVKEEMKVYKEDDPIRLRNEECYEQRVQEVLLGFKKI